MKTILLISAILSSPLFASAQVEVCNSSWTVNTVTVSSSAATLMDSASLVMQGRKWLEIQNIGNTDTVKCAQQSFTNSDVGRVLAKSGGSWELNLSERGYSVSLTTYTPFSVTTDYAMRIYCKSDGDGRTGLVTLSQCK